MVSTLGKRDINLLSNQRSFFLIGVLPEKGPRTFQRDVRGPFSLYYPFARLLNQLINHRFLVTCALIGGQLAIGARSLLQNAVGVLHLVTAA